MSWDGSIGGVLVFEVNGILMINVDIDVSFWGFRGGVDFVVGDNNCNFFINVDDYVYEIMNWCGLFKGEGIGFVVVLVLYGRGV